MTCRDPSGAKHRSLCSQLAAGEVDDQIDFVCLLVETLNQIIESRIETLGTKFIRNRSQIDLDMLVNQYYVDYQPVVCRQSKASPDKITDIR